MMKPSSIFKSFAFAASAFLLFASSASAQIANWDINFLQLLAESSNGNDNEITLKYEIGTGRSSYRVDFFTKGCAEADAITIPFEVFNATKKDTTTTTHDKIEIILDLNEQTFASGTSSIWNELSRMIEMCVRLQLLSGTAVINEDVRDINVEFDFKVQDSGISRYANGGGFLGFVAAALSIVIIMLRLAFTSLSCGISLSTSVTPLAGSKSKQEQTTEEFDTC